MAVNLSLDECATKVKKETDISRNELIFLKGGRPAFFAIKRMDPELASTAPKSPEPEEHIYIYQHCKTVCSRLLRLLDSLTPELVTYSYMSHWADREQCQWRLEILNRAKDKLRSTIIYAEEMFRVIEQVINSLLSKLPILVVDQIAGCMDDILNEDFQKFQAIKCSSEIVKRVFSYLCECCFVTIPENQLSAQDLSPKLYCDCHNYSTFCSICNLPNTPCSLCANVKVIFKTLRALGKCEFNSVGSYNHTAFKNELGGRTIEEQLEFASDSGCECSDVSDNDEAEGEEDQENTEDEGDED